MYNTALKVESCFIISMNTFDNIIYNKIKQPTNYNVKIIKYTFAVREHVSRSKIKEFHQFQRLVRSRCNITWIPYPCFFKRHIQKAQRPRDIAGGKQFFFVFIEKIFQGLTNAI